MAGLPRMFPLQTSRTAPAGPLSIPWSVAEKAYGEYARRYGKGQSLEHLAGRGGFGWCEMDDFHPGWRKEVDEITRLRSALEEVGVGVYRGGWLEDAERLWADRENDPKIPDPMVWVARTRELVQCMLKAQLIANGT